MSAGFTISDVVMGVRHKSKKRFKNLIKNKFRTLSEDLGKWEQMTEN